MKRRWTITSEKFLTPEQVGTLVTHLTQERDLAIARGTNKQAIRDYYMLRFLLETGVRVAEFCALKGSDIHGLRAFVRCGKGGKPRTILLTRTTANMVREWLVVKERLGCATEVDSPLFPSRFGTRYTTRGVQKRVKLVFAAASLPSHFSVHSLRHTYCSLLLATGKVGLATVKENLGHHSIAVTNLYAHATGNIDEISLYPEPSSEKNELDELQLPTGKKKPNSFVKSFLRNTNFKNGVPDK